MEFFRFPHTPHLAWLGPDQPRDDKVMSQQEADDLLNGEVLVEEKVDGANVGLSLDEHGLLRAQNRGTWLSRETCHLQFKPLFRWLDQHRYTLGDKLGPNLILFGEWCYAVHSVEYTRLPDWFLAFDVYDRIEGRFWSTERRDRFASDSGLSLVPPVAHGRFGIEEIQRMLGPSRLTTQPAEGLYIRRDEGGLLKARAKLVQPQFIQGIEAHWSGRSLRTNQLVSGVAW